MAQSRPRRRKTATYSQDNSKSVKINRSLRDQRQAKKAEKAAAKALYLSTLPKDKWKRLLYRLKPEHLYHYWFSRQGALMAIKLVGVAIVVGFFFTVGLFAYYRKDLPQIKDISGDSLGGSVSYYDSTGKVLLFQDYDGVKRTPVDSDQISPYMKDATVAIEDKNFYKEGAFDVRGIIRAAFHDIVGGGGLQGGSTITQQLVKLNEGWTNDRTITRKVKELILAVDVERNYSKDEILTAYLNIAPYGGVDYGVQSAAEDYFRTSAANLTLPQAAMLAAIPQAPSYYSPYGSTKFNPEAGNTFSASALLARQHYILQLMAQQGYITTAQAKAAEAVDVLAEVQPTLSKYNNIQDPYFVLAAKQQLINQFGSQLVNRGGLKVITTLNLQLQSYANQDIAANAGNVAAVGGDEEAMIAENVNNGQVVAMVGGENFNNPSYGQINYDNTLLSPGSSMKPFLYAALIQDNTDVGAGSVFYDTQGPLPGYACTNKAEPTATSNGGNCLWDDNFIYPGPETIRYALAGSRNVPAVKASYEIDPTDNGSDYYIKSINDWIDLANQATGFKGAYGCYPQNTNLETASASDQTQCYGSAAIGGGDIDLDQEINGDVTLARLGQEIPQTYILNVTDAAGRTLYNWTMPKPTQVYKADTAYIINDILDDPRATYLQPYQKFQNYDGWDIAVKTGTENQEYNGVMTAWSTQYAVIGFAGYHTLNKPLEEGHFEDITEPITRTWMEQALNALKTKPVNWTQPSDVKTIAGYVQEVSTGYGAEVPGPVNDVYPSWYKAKGATNSTNETIDKVSGFIATSCTPALAKETTGGASDAAFSVDIFYPKSYPDMQALEGGPVSASASQTDNVHNCNDTLPTITNLAASCSSGNSCVISGEANAGTHPLSGGSYTTSPAGTITVDVSGQNSQTISIPSNQSQSYAFSVSYTPSGSISNATVSAYAVDSVLYQSATASTTLSYTAPLSGFSYNSSTNTFSWSGGTPDYTVSDSADSDVCSSSKASCQPTNALPSGHTTFTLTDNSNPQQTLTTTD